MVTNLILNLHIVVVESMVEVAHAMKYQNGADIGHSKNVTNYLPHCVNPDSEFFNVNEISEITLYLYPFILELSLLALAVSSSMTCTTRLATCEHICYSKILPSMTRYHPLALISKLEMSFTLLNPRIQRSSLAAEILATHSKDWSWGLFVC